MRKSFFNFILFFLTLNTSAGVNLKNSNVELGKNPSDNPYKKERSNIKEEEKEEKSPDFCLRTPFLMPMDDQAGLAIYDPLPAEYGVLKKSNSVQPELIELKGKEAKKVYNYLPHTHLALPIRTTKGIYVRKGIKSFKKTGLTCSKTLESPSKEWEDINETYYCKGYFCKHPGKTSCKQLESKIKKNRNINSFKLKCGKEIFPTKLKSKNLEERYTWAHKGMMKRFEKIDDDIKVDFLDNGKAYRVISKKGIEIFNEKEHSNLIPGDMSTLMKICMQSCPSTKEANQYKEKRKVRAIEQ